MYFHKFGETILPWLFNIVNYFGWSHVYWNLKVWQKFCPLSLSWNTVSCCTKTNIPSTGCPSCQYFKPLCSMKPARFSIKNDMSELCIGERDSQILFERKGWRVHRDGSKPSRCEAREREKIRRKRGEGKSRNRLWECRSHPYIFSIFPGHIPGGGGLGYIGICRCQACAAVKGMVFKQLSI